MSRSTGSDGQQGNAPTNRPPLYADSSSAPGAPRAMPLQGNPGMVRSRWRSAPEMHAYFCSICENIRHACVRRTSVCLLKAPEEGLAVMQGSQGRPSSGQPPPGPHPPLGQGRGRGGTCHKACRSRATGPTSHKACRSRTRAGPCPGCPACRPCT